MPSVAGSNRPPFAIVTAITIIIIIFTMVPVITFIILLMRHKKGVSSKVSTVIVSLWYDIIIRYLHLELKIRQHGYIHCYLCCHLCVAFLSSGSQENNTIGQTPNQQSRRLHLQVPKMSS